MSIDVRELRLGNWISYKGKYEKVYAILNSDERMADGIPLTPELLEKCVLLKNGEFPDIEYFSVMNGSLFFEGNYTAVDIKYLHQLQNIYFALTGNELTITLSLDV